MGERYRTMLEQGIDPVTQAQMDRKASGFTDVRQLRHICNLLTPCVYGTLQRWPSDPC